MNNDTRVEHCHGRLASVDSHQIPLRHIVVIDKYIGQRMDFLLFLATNRGRSLCLGFAQKVVLGFGVEHLAVSALRVAISCRDVF
jgi:hypothetical protein